MVFGERGGVARHSSAVTFTGFIRLPRLKLPGSAPHGGLIAASIPMTMTNLSNLLTAPAAPLTADSVRPTLSPDPLTKPPVRVREMLSALAPASGSLPKPPGPHTKAV